MVPTVQAEFSFVHPGLLHSREDLVRMKAAVAAKSQPTFAGFEVFRANQASQAAYRMKGPFEEIGRSPNVHFTEFDQDANAAYQCALMWAITGDHAFAEKSIAIVNGWSANLKCCTGADAVLMAGLGPFKLINAAEILRYTDSGWSDAEARRCEWMFRRVIYPVTLNFAPFANGNWDAAALQMNLSIGVFCNNRVTFERALRYYVNGAGNGRLTHYVIDDAGQCQESGRDQQHSQLGLALLADCCEIAWHQGLDLYGYADNRLLKGFEYTAKYSLGESVPFTAMLDRTGKYPHTKISADGRGQLRAVYEQVYNHYVNRMGLAAPWTQKAAEKIRPEGAGVPGADHPGFGTLLFTRPPDVTKRTPQKPSAAPVAFIAASGSNEIKLRWIAPTEAARYAVMRSDVPGEEFKSVATELKSPEFIDRNLRAGPPHSYQVTASNAAGESPSSLSVDVVAPLPEGWSDQDIGAVAVAGSARSDGTRTTIEGAGRDIGGTNGQFHFLSEIVDGDAVISATFIPPVSSQFSKFGLMMREQPTSGAANVSFLISPRAGERGVERPEWNAALTARASSDTAASTIGSRLIAAPYVSYGRLIQRYFLKLERRGDVFTASVLSDLEGWTAVARMTNALPPRMSVGLAACSGLKTVTTTVQFDDVTILAGSK